MGPAVRILERPWLGLAAHLSGAGSKDPSAAAWDRLWGGGRNWGEAGDTTRGEMEKNKSFQGRLYRTLGWCSKL